MQSRATVSGFSTLDLFIMVVVALSIGLMVGVIAGRSLHQDPLDEAVAMISGDLERVRAAAIRTEAPMALRPVSERAYVAGGAEKALPGTVRFDTAASARSVSFTVWGTLVPDAAPDDPTSDDPKRIVLIGADGRRAEIRVDHSGELARP